MRRLPLVGVLAASLGLYAMAAPVTTATAADTRVVALKVFSAFPQAGAETTMTGTVSSTPSGSPVKIQSLRSGGSWSTVGQASTDATGRYSVDFVLGLGGATSFRAVAPATGVLGEATSPTRTLNVAAAPTVPFDRAPRPTISGSHTVGSVLTAEMGTWSPATTSFTYRWVRNGVPISRYVRRYQVTAEDLGAQLTIAIGAKRDGSQTIRESKPTATVGKGTFTTQPPVITGTAAVGETVRADISKWSPQPTTITYQWRRDQSPIPGASNAAYTLTPDDAGSSLSVEVGGASNGIEPVKRTSADVLVPGSPPTSSTTFGDQMRPDAGTLASTLGVTHEARGTAPTWTGNRLVRWDAAGAFTHSLTPRAAGTLSSANSGGTPNPATGAEYTIGNSVYKNADVSFDFTGTRFAVEYRSYTAGDAQIWVDGHPVSGSPVDAINQGSGASRNWIVVTLPQRRTVRVRFAGPLVFTGVHSPSADSAVIKASPAPFTLGVVSDSFFEPCYAGRCQSRSAAPMLSSLTGFRVWNMAQAATGYINDGSGTYADQTGDGRGYPGNHSSPYGSASRLTALKNAPIDALLVNGTINDQSVWSPGQHLAALEKLLDDVEAARPDLPVVLVGVEPLYYARRTWRLAHYSALTANFAGMVGRHENVVGFIDPYTHPWLTGSGYAGHQVGDGNQDQYVGKDGIHLNGDGQEYYQDRIADELEEMPLPVAP